MTTDEANALVERLRVYRDEPNPGLGIFEPGLDPLIATVETLELLGGLQTIVFADLDPLVQVGAGGSHPYWIAVELTARGEGWSE